MPRVDLPSGAWVEYRDTRKAGDRFAVNDAQTVVYEERADGTVRRTQTGGMVDRMILALLHRVITAWSFPGVPVPSQNIAGMEDLIDSVMDGEDYDALAEAVGPLFQAVLGSPKTSAARTAPLPDPDGQAPAAPGNET